MSLIVWYNKIIIAAVFVELNKTISDQSRATLKATDNKLDAMQTWSLTISVKMVNEIHMNS